MAATRITTASQSPRTLTYLDKRLAWCRTLPNHTTSSRLFPTLEELAQIPREEIPAVMSRFAALQGQLAARLLIPLASAETPANSTPDRLLSVREVVGRLSVTKGFVYDLIRRGTLPAVKLSERNTRIREVDLENYQKTRKALR